MSKKEEFEYNSVQDLESIRRYLNALIEGFERKELSFTSGRQTVVLNPKDLVEMSLKARKKGGKTKLSLKFSWQESDSASSDINTLRIFPEP